MNIQERFEKFYNSILLTPPQRNDAKTKYDGVCKKLHDYYYTNIEYSGNTKFLIGSYGKHTNIRPPRDVDVIFIMPEEKFSQYDDNQSNGQSQLLQDIRKILSEKYTTSEKAKGWGKVVLVPFSDGKHNIELLPAWKNSDGKFTIPNSENGGSWETWDPKSEIEKINNQELETKKTKKLIRMIKKWSEQSLVKIKSFEIEKLSLTFLNYYEHQDKQWSILIRDFFMFSYGNTGNSTIDSHLKTALIRAKKACEFEQNDNIRDASLEWQKVFGGDFPVAADLKRAVSIFSLEEKIQKLKEVYPSAKEEYLESKYGIKTIINNNYNFKIDATVEQKGFRNNFLSSFILRKLPLLKDKKLTFNVIKNTVPHPFDIKWKVRNFGDEARDASDLRGEISDDLGSYTKTERTKYRGEHYVECYVIKDSVCIAQDKILVPIGNSY
jgi:hypothetical protein